MITSNFLVVKLRDKKINDMIITRKIIMGLKYNKNPQYHLSITC